MERAKRHLLEMWNKVNLSIDERYSELMKMNELILGDTYTCTWGKKWCYNNNNNNNSNNNNSQISDSQKLNSQKWNSQKLNSQKLDSVKFGRRSSLGYVEEDKEDAVRRSRRKQERMVKMYVNEMMILTEKKEKEKKKERKKVKRKKVKKLLVPLGEDVYGKRSVLLEGTMSSGFESEK